MFDGLGSVRTTCNSSQTVTATATYEGFGATIASTGSTGSSYGFAGTSGYRNDGDAGLTHVGARYFDAQVGRFVTRDIDLYQHPFLYCEHDPANWVDPGGHAPWYEYWEVTGGSLMGGAAGIGGGIIVVQPETTPVVGPIAGIIGIIGGAIAVIGGIGHLVHMIDEEPPYRGNDPIEGPPDSPNGPGGKMGSLPCI